MIIMYNRDFMGLGENVMRKNAFTICLAGVPIAIEPMHNYIRDYCKDYLCDAVPEFTVAATRADLEQERRLSEAEDRLEGIPVRQFSDAYLETLAVYRKIAAALLSRDVLLYHGSCICVDGVGYLFTAKSGTGKSTHTALWRQQFGSRAVMINDDKPLLRLTEAGVLAYGTPWDGKHRLSTNTQCPLKAICVLERGQDNSIRPVRSKDVYPLLLQQCYRPKEPVALGQTLQLLDKILLQVKAYRLCCNMTPEAALVSYGGMSEEKI